MMKSNPVGTLLAAALSVAAAGAAGLFFTYVQAARQLSSLQTDMIAVNRNQAVLQNFVNEAVEFIQRDPSIEPILQSVGIRPKTAATSATAPAMKPTGKLP